MENLHAPASAQRLAAQLEHPNAKSIWNRAVEVFGDETKARNWMNSPREIFGGRSPDEIVTSGDAAGQRQVLEVLLRIDYGVLS